MRIRNGDEWIRTFKTSYDDFKYQVILFGLSNALTSFQEFMNKILAEQSNIFVTIYLNDILI